MALLDCSGKPYKFSWLVALLFISCRLLAADQKAALTNDAIIQLTGWHISAQEIVATIERNDSEFDLSASSIAILKQKGVDDSVLGEMWKATLKAAATTNPTPASPPQKSTGASNTQSNAAQDNKVPEHTAARFAEARAVSASTGTIVPVDPPCPVSGRGEPPARKVEIDWNSSSISPTRVEHSGPTCFELHNFNDILYLPGFTLTEKPISGQAIDLLTSAISTVTGINLGTQSSTDSTKSDNKVAEKQKSNTGASITRPECPATMKNDVNIAVGNGGLLQDALSQLDPGKDSAGKINFVPLSTSLLKWQPIPAKYAAFQAAVSSVIKDLNQEDADVCSNDILKAAEAVVIDAYLPVQAAYPIYASHADSKSSHIARYTSDLDATSGYDLAVKATYQGQDVNNGTKTFSLSAGRTIASASGGFLISELPARSYSSVTAPTGITNPATQNVLAVNYGRGPQIGLVGLVNFNLPDIPWSQGKSIPLSGRHYGFAISAGPTYGLSNGKADASRIGFFSGLSVHLWNQFFLTPGVHVGQFSDFPQGFTHQGQVIPKDTGTPQGINRITARFSFAITYKIKDFGSATTTSNTKAATANDATGSQGTTGSGNGAKNDKSPK